MCRDFGLRCRFVRSTASGSSNATMQIESIEEGLVE